MTPKEIRSRRLALGMWVEELARELAVSPEHMREMENVDRPVLNARLFEQVFTGRERDQDNASNTRSAVLR